MLGSNTWHFGDCRNDLSRKNPFLRLVQCRRDLADIGLLMESREG